MLAGTANQWDQLVYKSDGVSVPYANSDHHNLWIPGDGPGRDDYLENIGV